jgi:hypothetical protein
MRIARNFKGGVLLLALASGIASLAVVSFGFAAVDAAHAASKKAKHAKPSHAHAATTTSGGGAQPAPPGPPDPGVYK